MLPCLIPGEAIVFSIAFSLLISLAHNACNNAPVLQDAVLINLFGFNRLILLAPWSLLDATYLRQSSCSVLIMCHRLVVSVSTTTVTLQVGYIKYFISFVILVYQAI